MAPNDDALLIGGGLILLAIIAMGGGGDGEKTTEIIVISDDPAPGSQMPIDTRPGEAPPQQRFPQGFDQQKPKRSQQHPMFGQQQQRMREMTVEAHNLYDFYQDLERRVREVWQRITDDEKKRQILHPGTVDYLQELMADMNTFIQKVQAFPQRFDTSIAVVAPQLGQALDEAVNNVREIWKKFNALLGQSQENRDNTFLNIEDMNELQDELIARLNVDRMEYQFGSRGRTLRPSEEDQNFGDDARDDFQSGGGGKKRSPDGTVELTFGNTGGNKRHQEGDGNTAQTRPGTSNSTLNPGEDLKSTMDPHTVAHPESIGSTTNVPGPSNLTGQHALEDTNSGKKGKQQNTGQTQADLTKSSSTTGGFQLQTDVESGSEEETEETKGAKRQEPEEDDRTFTVSKVPKPDDLETENTEFTAKIKNEAETIAVAFSSGGLHGGSQLNPKVNVGWSTNWMQHVDQREYKPLLTWLQKQLQTTRSNEIAYETAERSGIAVKEIRNKQQVIAAKQHAIVAVFLDKKSKTTRKLIKGLHPAYFTDGQKGGWPIYLLTDWGPVWAIHPEKNTYENALNYLKSIDYTNLKPAQQESAKKYIPQGAALLCMWRHVGFAAQSIIVLGKRSGIQRQQAEQPRDPKRQKKPPGKD